MVPHGRFAQLCQRQYVVGDDYALGPVDEVSGKSRAHLFAALKDAWGNLPHEEKRFPTPEHFRKWLCFQVGHCTETDFVLDTVKDAQRTALALRKADEYAIIIRRGNVVKFCTAKSLAGTAIKGQEFQVVKTKILDLASSMARTSREALEQHAGQAA